jgi:hypothetical protein
MEMTTAQKSEALNMLCQLVADDPKTLNKAQNLLSVLMESPERFWEEFWSVMSQDELFRAEADAYMASAGIDAETRQSLFA